MSARHEPQKTSRELGTLEDVWKVVDLLGPARSEADHAGAEMIFTSKRPHALSQALMPFFGGRIPA